MALLPDIHVGRASSGGRAVTWYDSDPQVKARSTIILFHGTSGSAESSFWALFPMLAMRHRVVTFDFNDPAAGEPSSKYYLDQAKAVIDSACPDAAVNVAGYSFGAVIAAQFAARFPGRVRSLSLIAGWIKTDTHQRLRNDVWRSLYESSSEALAGFSVLTSFSQSFINSKNPAEIAALIEAMRNGPDRSIKMTFNRDVDITEEVSRITAPTLVIGCTHDVMVPIRHSKLLFGAIRDSRFVEIAAGHGIASERPSELFAVIDAFARDPLAHPPGTIIANSRA